MRALLVECRNKRRFSSHFFFHHNLFLAPMRNLSMLTLTPILSLFCLVFLFYHITLAFFTAPRYVPVDDITLDCGSATSNIRRIWMGETRVETFSPSSFPKTNIIVNLIPLTLQKKAP